MQWGHPQPRSGEGDEAMLRSGANDRRGAAALMIVDLPETSTNEINKKLDELGEKVGAVTMGRVLTLVIAPDSETILEESTEAANAASHEHPSRVIVVMTGDADAAEARLDGQLRAGGGGGAPAGVVL